MFNILRGCIYSIIVSASFSRLTYFINKNKSFLNKLNSTEPNVEPYRTPETNIFNMVLMGFFQRFVSFFLNTST